MTWWEIVLGSSPGWLALLAIVQALRAVSARAAAHAAIVRGGDPIPDLPRQRHVPDAVARVHAAHAYRERPPLQAERERVERAFAEVRLAHAELTAAVAALDDALAVADVTGKVERG